MLFYIESSPFYDFICLLLDEKRIYSVSYKKNVIITKDYAMIGGARVQERYLRNIPALSPEDCALMREKKIAIVGCGGLGGYLAEMLARIGCKELVLIDGDCFDTTNLNRQLYATPAVLGCNKAIVAADRIRQLNPELTVTCHAVYLEQATADALISGCDIVLDGLDEIAARKLLKNACTRAGIPYVYGAVAGWIAQTAISMPQDHLIDCIYPQNVPNEEPSVLSFTAAFCASMQAALCVKLLTGRSVQTSTIFYFDLLHQEYNTIPVKS